ncbi:hypothetical protein MRB53_038392 [Persea americana]|nr:hypothetical protein MRB53_038392 [Persea americana]
MFANIAAAVKPAIEACDVLTPPNLISMSWVAGAEKLAGRCHLLISLRASLEAPNVRGFALISPPPDHQKRCRTLTRDLCLRQNPIHRRWIEPRYFSRVSSARRVGMPCTVPSHCHSAVLTPDQRPYGYGDTPRKTNLKVATCWGHHTRPSAYSRAVLTSIDSFRPTMALPRVGERCEDTDSTLDRASSILHAELGVKVGLTDRRLLACLLLVDVKAVLGRVGRLSTRQHRVHQELTRVIAWRPQHRRTVYKCRLTATFSSSGLFHDEFATQHLRTHPPWRSTCALCYVARNRLPQHTPSVPANAHRAMRRESRSGAFEDLHYTVCIGDGRESPSFCPRPHEDELE